MFQTQPAAELGSFSYLVLTLQSKIQEKGLKSPFIAKESAEARHVSGMSLHEDPEKTLDGTVMVKP